LDNGVAIEATRSQLMQLIRNMESAKDQKSFAAHYQAFIGAAANHMTILAPFLTPLAVYLQSLAS
jgi:hypothetical protein